MVKVKHTICCVEVPESLDLFQGTFGDEGVTLLLKFLSLDSEKFSSGLGYHKLLLSSVNAIWCCVSFMNQVQTRN